jgi:hypothetical protein
VSRDQGFRNADIDTGLMADPKVVALSRRLRDPVRTMAAVGLYEAVCLASWADGRRLTLEESAPAWWAQPVDELAAHLVAVNLLDGEHRIPTKSWRNWISPALDRLLQKRRTSIFGGLVSHGMEHESANREADRRIAELRALYEVEPGPIGRAESPGLDSSTSVPSTPSRPEPMRHPKPVDSLASKPARSRPGLRVSRRDTRALLREDGEARADVERQRAASQLDGPGPRSSLTNGLRP